MKKQIKRLLVTAFLGLGLVLLALVACRLRATKGLSEHHFEFQGVERSFFVHLPPTHSKERSVPLVIALHGGHGKADRLNSGMNFGLTAQADARGWVLVVPQGVERGWNDGRPIDDRASRARAGIDDVAFIGALIDRAHARWGIDRERVFVTGISNGGSMSFHLAIALTNKLRAVAPVTMGLPSIHRSKTPQRPIAILIMNGTADPLVPYMGGQIRVLGRERGEVLSTDDTVEWWAKANGCTTSGPRRTLPDTDLTDGTRVHTRARTGCNADASVVLYEVEGGGHAWPGGRQYLPERMIGRVSRDIDASKVIFDFFAEHAK
ncbi:MAG: PHB depolymerase family esterase [Polyangiaceae bacterium]